MKTLEEFLQLYPANIGEKGTHTSMNGRPSPGKFLILDNLIPEFVDAVYNSIWNENKEWHLTEGHPKNGCRLVVDVDLRFPIQNLSELSGISYSMSDLIAIVRKYQQLIRILYPTTTIQDLECWVFQRSQGGYLHDHNHQVWKDGFHLLFPNVVLTYPVLHWIRARIVEWLSTVQLFQGTINTIEEMIDASVIEKGFWLMYGTTKPGKQPYSWTARIPEQTDPIVISNNEKISIDLYRQTSLLLSGTPWTTEHLTKEIREYGKRMGTVDKVKTLLGQSSETEGIPGTYIDTLQLVNDVAEGRAIMESNQQNETILTTNQAITGPIRRAKLTDLVRKENPQFVKDLLQLLKPERAQNYHDWFFIGAAIYHTNSQWFSIWNEWSSQASNYKESSCIQKWEHEFTRFTGSNPITIGTLRKIAREDNPKDYLNLMDRYKEKDEFFGLIRDGCASITEQDFARILHFMCDSEFVFAEGEWYQYVEHRWIQMPKKRNGQTDTTILRRKIGKDLLQYYMAYMIFLQNKAWQAQVEERITECDSYTNLIALVLKVMNRLKTATMKRHIIEEAEILFYRSGFVDKLDMNHYLLGFNNGIYNLKTNEFRPGHYSDYVSMTVGYEYTPIIKMDIRREIINMFQMIQPDQELLQFLLTFFASTLIGTNKNEIFVNLEGSGGNGKGVWSTFHDAALGEYAGTLNNNYLVNVSSSPESHNTMLATNYKKRYLQVNEPPNTHGKKLSTNFVKELTGGDKIQLRVAHSAETKTVEPMFKLCMLFNEFPTLENPYDGGFMRRFVGIHFPNKFVDGEPKRPNEFRRDPKLKEVIKTNLDWKQQYMILLLEYLRTYIDSGEVLPIPESVKRRSRELLSGQDPVEEFIRSEISVTSDDKDTLLRKDLYTAFQDYVKTNFMGQKISMRIGVFTERMIAILPNDIKLKARHTIKINGIQNTSTHVFFGLRFANETILAD